MPWQGIPLEEALPSCEKGDTFTVDEIKLLEKQTSPPDYLTEAELITLMEKHGIGERPGGGVGGVGLPLSGRNNKNCSLNIIRKLLLLSSYF